MKKINEYGNIEIPIDIDDSEILVGLGISDDWSFESDFLRHKKVPIFAYDASVNKKVFIKKINDSLPLMKIIVTSFPRKQFRY